MGEYGRRTGARARIQLADLSQNIGHLAQF